MMVSVYLGLGSNLDYPQQQVIRAIGYLADYPGLTLITQSSLYRSQPLGGLDQPQYVNAIIEIQTMLSPESLLAITQQIESQMGRVRVDSQRWQARVIDIDIIMYGLQSVQSPDLQIPHYAMKERAFVLYPLLEIAPDLVFPCGSTLRSCCDTLNDNDVEKISNKMEAVI